jgi:hypothetical protein
MHYIYIMYLNARGWSVRPKHVAFIDETNKFFFVFGGYKCIDI